MLLRYSGKAHESLIFLDAATEMAVSFRSSIRLLQKLTRQE